MGKARCENRVLTDALRKVNRIDQIEILGKGGESTRPSFQVHTLNKGHREAGRTAACGLVSVKAALAGEQTEDRVRGER